MENNKLFDFIAEEISKAKAIDLESAKSDLIKALKETGVSLENREDDFADFELMAILESALGEFPEGEIPKDSNWGRLKR